MSSLFSLCFSCAFATSLDFSFKISSSFSLSLVPNISTVSKLFSFTLDDLTIVSNIASLALWPFVFGKVTVSSFTKITDSTDFVSLSFVSASDKSSRRSAASVLSFCSSCLWLLCPALSLSSTQSLESSLWHSRDCPSTGAFRPAVKRAVASTMFPLNRKPFPFSSALLESLISDFEDSDSWGRHSLAEDSTLLLSVFEASCVMVENEFRTSEILEVSSSSSSGSSAIKPNSSGDGAPITAFPSSKPFSSSTSESTLSTFT
uniref:Putative secreted protein n=1 Tax=Rhipicephalus microplus TaxID=6941 RepID=A0A6G5A6F7_RHIMP